MGELRKHVPILRAAIKSREETQLETAIDGASAIWFEIKLLKDARAMVKSLKRAKEMVGEIARIVQTDADKNYDSYEKMIVEMDLIQRHDSGAFQDANAKKLRAAFASVEARRECQGDLKE